MIKYIHNFKKKDLIDKIMLLQPPISLDSDIVIYGNSFLINNCNLIKDQTILKYDGLSKLSDNDMHNFKQYLELNNYTFTFIQTPTVQPTSKKLKLVKINESLGWDKDSLYVFDLKTLKVIGKRLDISTETEELTPEDHIVLKIKNFKF